MNVGKLAAISDCQYVLTRQNYIFQLIGLPVILGRIASTKKMSRQTSENTVRLTVTRIHSLQ